MVCWSTRLVKRGWSNTVGQTRCTPPQAREATSRYNKEVRQLRWNLQAAVQCARDSYDTVQDELIGLQDRMEEAVRDIDEAGELEADLYAERDRIERQILMNEEAKADMQAKRAMRRAKVRIDGWDWVLTPT